MYFRCDSHASTSDSCQCVQKAGVSGTGIMKCFEKKRKGKEESVLLSLISIPLHCTWHRCWLMCCVDIPIGWLADRGHKGSTGQTHREMTLLERRLHLSLSLFHHEIYDHHF